MLRCFLAVMVSFAILLVAPDSSRESHAIGFIKSVTPLNISPKGPGVPPGAGTPSGIDSLTPLLTWSGSDYFTQKRDSCVFAFYRVIVRDDQGRAVIDEVVDTDATSYKVPPGILQYGRIYSWSFELITASLGLNQQTKQIEKNEYRRKGSPESLFFKTPSDPRQAGQPAAQRLSAQLVSSSVVVNPQQALLKPAEKVLLRIAGGNPPYLIENGVAGLGVKKISDTEFELTMPTGRKTHVLATQVQGSMKDIKKIVIMDSRRQQFVFYYGAE